MKTSLMFAFAMICSALLASRPVHAEEAELSPPPPGSALALTMGGVGAILGGGALIGIGAVIMGPPGTNHGDSGFGTLGAVMIGVGAAPVVAGIPMLGVGAARIVSYKRELRLAYRDPAQRLAVLARIHKSMESDRIGLIVTGTLTAIGAGIVVGSGILSAFVDLDAQVGIIPGAVLFGGALFPLIGYGASYSMERSLLGHGAAATPVEVSVAPMLSQNLYGLSMTGRF